MGYYEEMEFRSILDEKTEIEILKLEKMLDSDKWGLDYYDE